MCSAGSSNVNILHPPSHSPVPGPGIPHPSKGRLVPALFLFPSCTQTDTHTQTSPFFFFCPRATTSDQLFPSSLPRHIHFFISSLQPSHPSPFLRFPSFLPYHLFTPPSTTLHLHPASLPSAALSFGFICMAERKGCRQSGAGPAEPSCVHPGQGWDL